MRAPVCALAAAIGLAAQPAFAQADRTAAAFWKNVQATCDAAAAKPAGRARPAHRADAAIDEFNSFGGHRDRCQRPAVPLRPDRGGARGGRRRRAAGERRPSRLVAGDEILAVAVRQRHRRQDRGARLSRRLGLDQGDAGRRGVAHQRRAAVARRRQRVRSGEREMLREAALRAAIIDTPWSAAFISYVIRQAGVGADAFQFANAHRAYIYDAFAASAAEPANQAGDRLYRACPLTTTKPRPGDLICQQREPALADASDEAVRERIRTELAGGTDARSIRRTHCEVVAYVDARARKVYTIGGNVNQSVTARKLNLRRGLKFSAAQKGHCGGAGHWTLPQSAGRRRRRGGHAEMLAQRQEMVRAAAGAVSR